MAWACRRTGESTFERGVQAGRHFQRTNAGDQANHGEEKGETTGGNERRRPVVRARLNLPASQVGRGVVHVGGLYLTVLYFSGTPAPSVRCSPSRSWLRRCGCAPRRTCSRTPTVGRWRAHALRPGAYRTVTSLLWLGLVAGGGGEGAAEAMRTHARHPHHHAHSAPHSTHVAGRGT